MVRALPNFTELGSQMHRTVLGIVIVTYNSAEVIRDCLETLFSAAGGITLRAVVVDNSSLDTTVDVIVSWAAGDDGYTLPDDLPFTMTPLTKPVQQDPAETAASSIHLIRSDVNGGFAAGVNIGLAHLAKDPAIERFWVLNPDCVVPLGTA